MAGSRVNSGAVMDSRLFWRRPFPRGYHPVS